MSSTALMLPEVAKQHEQLKSRSLWQDAWRRAIRNPFTVTGAIIIILFVLAAIFGPMLSPYDYREQDLLNAEQPPTAQHWFGTDDLGRDMFTRVLYGARTAFLVATM